VTPPDYCRLFLLRSKPRDTAPCTQRCCHAIWARTRTVPLEDCPCGPPIGPVKTLKGDLVDGFYRVWVHIHNIPKLRIAFPVLNGEEPLITFPLCLPMGWTESPPYFCLATETITDVANERIMKWRNPPQHKLEAPARSPPAVIPVPVPLPPSEPTTTTPDVQNPLIP
jgi:hypothetical protein